MSDKEQTEEEKFEAWFNPEFPNYNEGHAPDRRFKMNLLKCWLTRAALEVK